MTEITEAQVTDPPPTETPGNLAYIPQALRQRVMQLVHSNPSSGHPGITATVQLLNNKFWWPTLRTDTYHIHSKLHHLQYIQIPASTTCWTSSTVTHPTAPWSHLAIDFVTDLPASQGHTTILTVIDRFSKACRLIPLPKLPTALENGRSSMQQCIQVLWST